MTVRPGLALSLVLLFAFGIAACDSASAPAEDVLADLDAAAILATVDDRMEVFDHSVEANTVLWLAIFDIANGEPAGAMRPAATRRLESLRLLAAASVSPFAVRAASVRTLDGGFGTILGKTFVYDPGSGSWVADEDRTGAPANGFRIIWYATVGGFGIATPLVERGYVDITDFAFENEEQLGFRVRAVNTEGGSTVVADYALAVSQTDDGNTWSESFEIAGFVSDGTEQVDFSLASGETESAGGFDFSLDVAMSASGFAYGLSITVTGTSTSEVGAIDLSLTTDGVTTSVELAWQDGSTATGSLRHRGVRIADITVDLDTDTVTFTRVGGGAFTPAEQQMLSNLFLGLLTPIELFFYAFGFGF